MRALRFFVLIAFLLITGCKTDQDPGRSAEVPELRNGDLIFQTSDSRQSHAIQLATGSRYSHVGLIYDRDGELLVLEAVQPVKLTPISEWIERGTDDHYVVKRLKNADELLTPSVIEKMKTLGKNYLGKDYDLHFEWSDDRIYCSELVWKLYDGAAGIQLSRPEHLRDFDLEHPSVRSIMVERYGDRIPLDEQVVSPAALFDSPLLTTVP